MKIITLDIYPESRIYIKDFIIKEIIKNNQKYVEMEDEILIDTNILIRFRYSEKIIMNEKIFKPIQLIDFIDDKSLIIETDNYKNKQKKKQIKAQSRLVNNKIKNYNQRRR